MPYAGHKTAAELVELFLTRLWPGDASLREIVAGIPERKAEISVRDALIKLSLDKKIEQSSASLNQRDCRWRTVTLVPPLDPPQPAANQDYKPPVNDGALPG